MYFKTQFIQLIYVTAICVGLYACNGDSHQPANTQTEAAKISEDSVMANDESIKALSNQLEADPENAELYYQRASVYFNNKYLDRALSDIEDAVKYNVQNPLYHYLKGRILYAMNKTQLAATSYESAIALKPDYEEAQMKLAELYYVVKEHTKSIDLTNSLIAHNPANANAYCLKADNQRELKDTLKAIASYQKALELDEKYYDAAMQLGLLLTAKKHKTAKEYFDAAIRINPRSSEAYFGRAFYHQQAGEYQKALFDYRKVIDIDPSNDKSYYNVGIINFDVKKYDEALRSWDICIQMNNQNIDAYYMRGLVHESRGNKKDALLNYQYALELNPNYALAKEGLARLKR
jgi:tetratricopeptide (TPR) repeat protein